MDENTKSKLLESRTWIREELERCIGFWLNNGMDPVNGGLYLPGPGGKGLFHG